MNNRNQQYVLVDRSMLAKMADGLKQIDVRGYDSNEVRSSMVHWLENVVMNEPGVDMPEDKGPAEEKK